MDSLGEGELATLQASFNIDESNGVKCAESARFWEKLLETHRQPFIILRVADMRYVLQSDKSMALQLYEEVRVRSRHDLLSV